MDLARRTVAVQSEVGRAALLRAALGSAALFSGARARAPLNFRQESGRGAALDFFQKER